MSDNFTKELNQHLESAQHIAQQGSSKYGDNFLMLLAASLSNIAESLFELNESVKVLVEEIKREKKNDT